MSERKIIIFDTTLRDGAKTPGVNMSFKDKLNIARQLDILGVDVIEAGFPADSKQELESVAGIAAKIRRPIIAAMAGTNFADIDIAWEALKEAAHPKIHVSLPNIDFDLEHQFKKDQQGVLNMAVEAVRHAKSYCNDVQFSTMDASRSKGEEKYLFNLIEAVISAGATTVNIPENADFYEDSYAFSEFSELIGMICKPQNVRNIEKAIVSVHCHENGLRWALPESLGAIAAGAGQVEGCINGIGERRKVEWKQDETGGNTALEEVVMNLYLRNDLFEASTNIDFKQIYPTSLLVQEITGVRMPPNKPFVGENSWRYYFIKAITGEPIDYNDNYWRSVGP